MNIKTVTTLLLLTIIDNSSTEELNVTLDEETASQTTAPQTNRIILSSERWKILQTNEVVTRMLYIFELDDNEWDLDGFEFPTCTEAACEGLLEYKEICENMCTDNDYIHDRLRNISSDHKRITRSLHAKLSDLKAITSNVVAIDAANRVFLDTRTERRINVLQPYTTAIGDIVQSLTVMRKRQPRQFDVSFHSKMYVSVNEIRTHVDKWMADAGFLLGRLTSVLHELHKAELHLQLCTQSVHSLDMSVCEPNSVSTGYYTDTPTNVFDFGEDVGLQIQTIRETWDLVTLSRWYMAFINIGHNDSTEVCWLTRDMVTDRITDYNVPYCDRRGLCNSLLNNEDKTT